MEIKAAGKNFYGAEKYEIELKKGESVVIRVENQIGYIEIACDNKEKMLFTTHYTQNMKMYPYIEGSQRLLGISPKRCKCGDERGGLPHLHPNYITFEPED